MNKILPAIVVLSTLPSALPAADYFVRADPRTVVIGNYSAATPPAIAVKSGDSVAVETVSGDPANLRRMGLKESEIPSVLIRISNEVKQTGPGMHILTGPIFVEGAEPGDTLEVTIKNIEVTVPWAYNSFRPGRGFLPEDFTQPASKLIPIDLKNGIAQFGPNINIPIRPFFGSMGVAPPASAGKIDSAPPGQHAGNLDNKELTSGSVLLLPVNVKGALFQIGDGHAGQGDGEVDITAMETCLRADLRFVVRKDLHLKWPRAETPTHYITMGMDKDLNVATKQAVREMIDFLVSVKGLSREDAYMLSSVAADFSITQLVDGTVGVHGKLPKAIFPPNSKMPSY